MVGDVRGRGASLGGGDPCGLRMVGTKTAKIESEKLENFIASNVRHVVRPGASGVKKAPSEIDKEALELARTFADRAHGDVTRLHVKH